MAKAAVKEVKKESLENFKKEFGIEARQAKSKHDYDKVAELWANFVMVQQIKGNDKWLKAQQKSGKDWFPYVHSLGKEKDNRFVILKDEEKIFGFAFLKVADLDKKAKTYKGVLQEIYLEPSHRLKQYNDEMAFMVQECIDSIGIKEIKMDLSELTK